MHVLGAVIFGALMIGAVTVLVRLGRRIGVAAAVLAGLAIRLVVMLIAHAISVHQGTGGMMFIDDITYYQDGKLLAAYWGAGHLVDPQGVNFVGSLQFGFQSLVGVVFTLVGDSVVAAKLVNVLAGGATILICAHIADVALGRASVNRAAWFVALLPSAIWWSAPMLKEAAATMLFALALLLALRTVRKPMFALPALLVLLALAVTRASAAVSVAVPAGAAMVTLAVASVRSGELGGLTAVRRVGGLAAAIVLAVLVVSRGHVAETAGGYRSLLSSMFHSYQGGNIGHLPVDLVKSTFSPLPWAFDRAARTWDAGLYPGMWAIYALLPLAARGAWRRRASLESRIVIAAATLYMLENCITSGFIFRQRSVVEPFIALFAVAGISSWQGAARWTAAAWAAVGAYATVHTRSPAVSGAIAAAVLALLVASRRAGALRWSLGG
jgi:hypothetical protein